MCQIIKEIDNSIPTWLTEENLQLIACLKGEWAFYTEDLRRKGLLYDPGGDSVIWNGPREEGMLIIEYLYNKLNTHKSQATEYRTLQGIWENSSPLKMKLFLWLVLMDKNLTWENLKRRGNIGTG